MTPALHKTAKSACWPQTLTAVPAEWLSDAIARIEELAKLAANWDSYGATPVCGDAISKAIEFVGVLARVSGMVAPEITATPEGHVGLYWDDGVRSVDASVDSTGLICFSRLGPGAGEEHSGKTGDLDEFIQQLVSE